LKIVHHKLLPPTTTNFKLYCSCGTLVTTQNNKGVLNRKKPCPSQKCKNVVDLNSLGSKVTEETFRTPGLENAYDGLSSMQEWIMADMADKSAQGELKGEGSNLGGVIISGEEKIGGNNRAHYGFAQSRGERWILDTTAIPGLVAPPIWTSLEEKSTDKETNITQYGPKLAGSAKTSVAPQWVGNCLGTQVYQDAKHRNIWKLNLTGYRDPVDMIPHLCKNRSMPGLLPDYLEDLYDEDNNIQRFNNFNLGNFFDLLDTALAQVVESAKAKYVNAPGLPSGKIGGNGPAQEVKTTEDNSETMQETTSKASAAPRQPKVGARVVNRPVPVKVGS